MSKVKARFAVGLVAVLLLVCQVMAVPGVPGRGGRGMFGRAGVGPGMRGPRAGAVGQRRFGAPGGCDAAGLVRLLRWLDLTDEQRQVIQAVLEDNREQLAAAHQAVTEARQALNELVFDGADEQAVRQAAEVLAAAVADEAVLRAGVISAVKEALTDEQLESLSTLRQRLAWMRQRGRGPQFRPQPDPMSRPGTPGAGRRWGSSQPPIPGQVVPPQPGGNPLQPSRPIRQFDRAATCQPQSPARPGGRGGRRGGARR